ncbi:hypothetical protein B0H19DRAFT_1161371 [Mycena capillaripes]|nr:hypothetical protein B0H19DRAFT_1161371 [Mycena capillaripes]
MTLVATYAVLVVTFVRIDCRLPLPSPCLALSALASARLELLRTIQLSLTGWGMHVAREMRRRTHWLRMVSLHP